MSEMKRDCAFFQLPDDVKIEHDSPTLRQGLGIIADSTKKIREECSHLKQAAEEEIKTADEMLRHADATLIAMWIVERVLENRVKLPEVGAAPVTLDWAKDIAGETMLCEGHACST